MHFTTLVSAATVLAVMASKVSALDYLLKAQVSDPAGNQSYNGQFVRAFHVGAGRSATVLVADEGSARGAYLYNGVLYFSDTSGINWSFSMTDVDAPSPAPGYVYVGINVGVNDPGFSLDANNKLHWDGNDFGTFAICPRVIPPYENRGVQAQVFWRGDGSLTDDNCTDVEFVAVLPTAVA